MNSKSELITPEVAKDMLTHNLVNRTVKRSAVETYARDMKRGVFKESPQGISFDTEGTLIDGQHRLLAVIASGVPVTMYVTRDCAKDSADYIDRGVTRSVKDVVTIAAKKDGSLQNTILSNQKLISTLSQLAVCSVGSRFRTSVNDVRALMEEFSPAATQVYNNLLSKSKMSARAPMFAAAVAAITCGVDADAISKFFQIVFCDDVTGCDNYNINAAINFKRQVEQAKVQRIHIDRSKLFRCTQNAIYHFVNNTGVTKIVAPSECRYDVSAKVEHALSAA